MCFGCRCPSTLLLGKSHVLARDRRSVPKNHRLSLQSRTKPRAGRRPSNSFFEMWSNRQIRLDDFVLFCARRNCLREWTGSQHSRLMQSARSAKITGKRGSCCGLCFRCVASADGAEKHGTAEPHLKSTSLAACIDPQDRGHVRLPDHAISSVQGPAALQRGIRCCDMLHYGATI